MQRLESRRSMPVRSTSPAAEAAVRWPRRTPSSEPKPASSVRGFPPVPKHWQVPVRSCARGRSRGLPDRLAVPMAILRCPPVLPGGSVKVSRPSGPTDGGAVPKSRDPRRSYRGGVRPQVLRPLPDPAVAVPMRSEDRTDPTWAASTKPATLAVAWGKPAASAWRRLRQPPSPSPFSSSRASRKKHGSRVPAGPCPAVSSAPRSFRSVPATQASCHPLPSRQSGFCLWKTWIAGIIQISRRAAFAGRFRSLRAWCAQTPCRSAGRRIKERQT